MLFKELMEGSLVEAGVYLNLHPNCEGVIEAAVETYSIDDLLRLALVVSTVGHYPVEHFVLELRKRMIRESDQLLRDQMMLLIETILRQNDEVAERIFERMAG